MSPPEGGTGRKCMVCGDGGMEREKTYWSCTQSRGNAGVH